MVRLPRLATWLLCQVLVVGPLGVAKVHALDLRAGLSWMDFEYKEFDDAGEILDREDGSLPGLGLGVTQPFGRWSLDAEFTWHVGSAGYSGQTQDRVPVSTDTDEAIWDTSVYMTYSVPERPLRVVAGLGYRYWERDIQPSRDINGRPVAGLLEYYYWYYLMLGMQFDVVDELSFDFRALWPIDATMELALAGANTRFDLGERPGLRLAAPWRKPLSQRLTLTVEPYLQYWQFDASPSVYVPELSGWAYEPDNDTLSWGLRAWLAAGF